MALTPAILKTSLLRLSHRNTVLHRLISSSQSSLDISGVFPAITTPFNEDFTLAFDKLKDNFDKWNRANFSGYVVLGSNGESVLLSAEEKLLLLKQSRGLTKPGQLVIAGTGCQSTAETIELNRQVAKDGSANAALVITPSFYRGRMTDAALEKHYAAVADSSPLPVILYSVPGNTNLDLSADVIIRLAQHENIIGLKDSGGDIGKVTQIVHATKGQAFQVLVGSAGVLLPALLMGCVGAISGLANVLGQELCELYSLYGKGDLTKAVLLQQRLVNPNGLVTRKFGVGGLKAAMDMMGFYGGPPRPPLLPANIGEMEQLKRGFQQANFLN